MRRKTPLRAAFTLIEVLLAISILGIITTIVGAVLHTGTVTWKMACELSDEGHDGDAVMEQIVMALRSAYYPANGEPSYDYGFWLEDGGEDECALDEISWVKIGNSLIGEDTPWAGTAHRVKLFVNDSQDYDGPGLYVSAWQIVGQDEEFDPDEDVIPILLSDQVKALDCRPQDPDKIVEIGEPYEWLEEWETSNRIPVHVQITLTMRPQEHGADSEVLRRVVPIPMSAVSWNPAKVGDEGKNGSNRNRRTGNGGNGPAISGGGFSGAGNRGSFGNRGVSGGSGSSSGMSGRGGSSSGGRGSSGGGSSSGGFSIGGATMGGNKR